MGVSETSSRAPAAARHAADDPRTVGVALVTGASRGIGAATARALARDGWRVAVNYRADEAGALATCEAIGESGGTAFPVRADVADPAACERALAELEDEFGPVLVLVNNAGIRRDGLAPQLSDDDWSAVLDVNLSAPFRLTRRVLGPMLRRRFGRIVNVVSVVGPLRANAGQANYAAAKAGLAAVTRTVAVEVARRGITVNAVAPGLVETELTKDVGERLVPLVPARRAGTCEEIAAVVRFLCSPEASYVTGAVIPVDGGLSA